MSAALLLALAALAGEPSGDPAFHRDQAALFARRGWWADAEVEIALALAAPPTAGDLEAWALGAQIAWENLDVPASIARAERAAALSTDEDRQGALLSWAERLRLGYGQLEVRTTQPGVVSRLQIEPESPPFDPEDQRFARRAALRWRDRTPLPVTISLPVGRWLVNGEPVEVLAGQTVPLVLPLRLAGRGALAALQVTRLELTAGVSRWTGERLGGLYPAGRLQLSLTQPAGPLLLGLAGSLDLQAWDAVDHGLHASPPGLGLGLRLGGEIFLGGPLALRPSATLGLVRVPGLALACDEGRSAWSCAFEAPSLGPAHHVYVSGAALAPGVELLLEHREAGRTTALGSGVKLSLEHAFGRLPSAGEATDAEGLAHPWESAERTWSGTRFSMLANVAFAF